ncbi:MAG: cation transporter [Thermoproteota archaeon]
MQDEAVKPGSSLKLLALLVVIGSAVKTAGAVVGGSRALLIDSLTCYAGLVALIATYWYLWASRAPPDSDHPYGHARLKYGGLIVTLSAYMFASGAGTIAVATGIHGYSISAVAVPFAVAGALIYAVALALSRGLDPVIRRFAGFTATEIVESSVSVVGAYLGSRIGFYYDLGGALIILLYVIHEAVEAHRYLVRMISDRSAPANLYEVVRREAEARGLEMVNARLRMVDEVHCVGDIEVSAPHDMPLELADMLADELADSVKNKGCDVSVHVSASSRVGSRRGSGEGWKEGRSA